MFEFEFTLVLLRWCWNNIILHISVRIYRSVCSEIKVIPIDVLSIMKTIEENNPILFKLLDTSFLNISHRVTENRWSGILILFPFLCFNHYVMASQKIETSIPYIGGIWVFIHRYSAILLKLMNTPMIYREVNTWFTIEGSLIHPLSLIICLVSALYICDDLHQSTNLVFRPTQKNDFYVEKYSWLASICKSAMI